MPARHAPTVVLRSRIAGLLEFVIAGWALVRLLRARSVAAGAAEAAELATSLGHALQLLFAVASILVAVVVGAWLIRRGPTRVIDVLMRISLAIAIGTLLWTLPSTIHSLPSLASSLASVVLAFLCWKFVRDDLRVLAAGALVAGVVATGVAIREALDADRTQVGGWIEFEAASVTLHVAPVPSRARLIARDEVGGWCEVMPPDPETGLTRLDLSPGRWFVTLSSPTPLDPATTLRCVVAADAPASAQRAA